MPMIKQTFDANKNIFKTIEKVITFDTRDEAALKTEITEYVVTAKLRSNFEKLLDKLEQGMNADNTEAGIWVSGFYGSGKSSFAKNFGLALEKDLIIDGVPFRERLANRINSTPISQQLKGLIEKYNPTIFLINLATKRLTLGGNILPPVSDVVYHQVMKWAGYAPEEKIALLERKLEMEGKMDQFIELVKTERKEDWNKVKFTDTLTAKGIAQDLAPMMYPNIWKDARSFNIMRFDSLEDESDRIKAMLQLIKKRTGKENVLFIIDEVGNYIAAKPELIDHLAGTMENFKDIGKGKAWLMATAQQTLTEDNPNARLNSDKFFKLDARFPIKIDIEASDIKEITTQRLLGKSDEGCKLLKGSFIKSGEQLRLNTRLNIVGSKLYKSELDERSFIDLYPFLPYQFDVILSLLARLAKKTGGIGLRSAIRVIQDILTDNDKLAEKPVGTLATAFHIYDVLHSDIRQSYSHIPASVDKVSTMYGIGSKETQVAKAIAVLQILDDFNLSIDNLAVAIHPSIDSPGIKEEVRTIVDELKGNHSLTLKEIDGQLRFMTDAIIRIEDEKQRTYVRINETREVIESQIIDIFSPVPNARILNSKTVKTGVQFMWANHLSKLIDPGEEIQTEIHLSLKSGYEAKLNELKILSTEKNNENKMYFLGVLESSPEKILEEIVRCQEIFKTRTKYTDKEVLDYLNGQQQEITNNLKPKLNRELGNALSDGEMLFRGTSKPTSQVAGNLKDAANHWLKSAAEKIYHKYNQVPLTLEITAAQKLLQFDDLRVLPPALKYFDVINSDGSINLQIPAIQSIKDYLQAEVQVDGRKLLENFMAAPFGWNRESTRYIVSAMFIASFIKLKISGDWVKVKGPSAIDKLSSNQNFHQVGVSLYTDGQPTQQQVLAAHKNLTELTGVTVAPLPQKISEVVMKHFPHFQTLYADLPLRLKTLNLPGMEKADAIREGIEEILKGDASDATYRLGKEDADLYLALKWAKNVYLAIKNGIEKPIQELQMLHSSVILLPDEGLLHELKNLLSPRFETINRILKSENFFDKAPELNDNLAEIKNAIENVCEEFRVNENENIKSQIEKLKSSYSWGQLNDEQKVELSNRLQEAFINEKEGIKGINEIINEAYSFSKRIDLINIEIETWLKANEPEPSPGGKKRRKIKLSSSRTIEKKEDIENIILELKQIKNQISDNEIIELNW